MSRNDVIVVLRYKSKYHILKFLNADTQWNARACVLLIQSGDSLVCPTRGDALVRAHNIQRRDPSEYGVRELFLRRRRASKTL
jgi:hypothetical protein